MISLCPIIERIKALLSEGSDQSITYAALEARLALEKVCYDRLRQAHDYISHDQLRRWQPRAVVNTLMSEVDEHVAETRALLMSRGPAVPGVIPPDEEFVEIGTEVGFDPKRIGELWNALSGLALHVKLPKNKTDHIPRYGENERIRKKVCEVVDELVRLSKTRMSFSGIGKEVSFVCSCGEKNRRRAALLRDEQVIHCINPECKVTWKTSKQDGGFAFEPQTADVSCENCNADIHIPWHFVRELRDEDVASFSCGSCHHKNFVRWQLVQVRPETADTQINEADIVE